MRFLLLFGFLASIIRCGSLPIKVLSDFPWGDDSSLATALTRVKKDADSFAYLEECALVESWQEQPGSINVLAFLDASWEYSHRQATMLEMLQGRLERSGITGIKFFVINSAHPEAAVNMVDVEDEKEAWGAVELREDQAFTEIEQTRDALKAKIGPDIVFVQDTNELKIWEKLSASRDQVLVIDKCGRLSYRVIVPWSILHFPYVKAAILSTYKEQPCGKCNLETTTAAAAAETQTEELTELLPEEFNIKEIEKIAAKKYNLDESDNAAKKVHHVTEFEDIPEDVIKLLNESANIKHEKDKANFNDTKAEKLILKQSWNFDDINYSQAPNPIKENSDNSENRNPSIDEDTSYNNSSSAIINKSIEHESSNDRYNDSDQSEHLGSKFEVDDSESIESTNLTNILQNSEETNNSMRSNESGDGYINDNSSDYEEQDTSASLSEDQTENRIITSTEDDSESADYIMPMRIIMHAPHIHEYEEPKKKYEYLVLKFGDPEYHKHLEYDDDFVSTDSDASFEKHHIGRNENRSDTHEEIDEAELGSGEVSGNGDEKKHRHHSDHHGHKHSHKKSKAEHIVYDKDESPGFYGEDAEYWTNFGNSKYPEPLQIEESVEKAEHGKDSEMELEGFYVVNITETNENNSTSIFKSSQKDIITDKNTSRYENFQTNIDSAEPNEGKIKEEEFSDDEEVDRSNTKEDEVAKHLIEHYSKLIPWLDYVMDE